MGICRLNINIYIFIKLPYLFFYFLSSTVMFFSAVHAQDLRNEKILCEIDESIAS